MKKILKNDAEYTLFVKVPDIVLKTFSVKGKTSTCIFYS